MDCYSMDSLEEKMSGSSGTLSLCKFVHVLHLELPNITVLISSFILVLPHGRDPSSVGSVWAGSSVLGWFFHCSSRSCCVVPGAAQQDSELLHQSGVPNAGNQGIIVWVLTSGWTHLAGKSGYCPGIAHQRLKHGPRFRKWKYCCRWIQSTLQLQKEQFFLHSNTELSEQHLRNPLCAPALANNCCNQHFPILSKARDVTQRQKLLTQTAEVFCSW